MTFTATFKKTAFVPAIALAAALPFASVAHADEGESTIVVTSQAEMTAWQKDANRSLNRSLQNAQTPRSASISSGIVQVTFDMDADGTPSNVEVLSSDANWAAERVAKRAVRQLGDISDVPVTNSQDARFLANIVFASSPEQHEELTQQLKKSMSEGFAAGSDDYILLGG